MTDREYIIKEIGIVIKYIVDDNEQFENKKQVYARVYNSIKGSVICELGGLGNLDISNQDLKQLIKDIVEERIGQINIS